LSAKRSSSGSTLGEERPARWRQEDRNRIDAEGSTSAGATWRSSRPSRSGAPRRSPLPARPALRRSHPQARTQPARRPHGPRLPHPHRARRPRRTGPRPATQRRRVPPRAEGARRPTAPLDPRRRAPRPPATQRAARIHPVPTRRQPRRRRARDQCGTRSGPTSWNASSYERSARSKPTRSSSRDPAGRCREGRSCPLRLRFQVEPFDDAAA
jgi:hypothetical protein